MASISTLFGSEPNANRVSRGCSFVVHVELADWRKTGERGFEELDADDYAHARRLACSWVNMHGAMSAAIRAVEPNGAIRKVCEFVNPGDGA